MSRLEWSFDWQEVPGSCAPEIRATMANFEILAAGKAVTRVHDRRSRSVRDSILTPLYPPAEWIASVWWNLLEESAAPTRDENFRERHSLVSAERGFPLPDFELCSDGAVARVRWRPRETRFATVDFLAGGECTADLEETRQSLRDFVEAVIGRLEQQGIADTWLQTEWAAISATDAAEADFCRTAGRLGRDPYHLDDATADAMQEGRRRFLPELWDECCRAIRPDDLAVVMECLTTAAAGLRDADPLPLSRDMPVLLVDPAGETPWKRGYDLARRFRQALTLPDDAAFDLENFLGDPVAATIFGSPAPAGIDGLAETAPGRRPRLWSGPAKQRPESLRFLHARALMDAVSREVPSSALLTTARTARQQQGRAFAAELLAPASLLARRLAERSSDPDVLDDCAAELRVSPQVVRHQVQNHRLAEIVE